MYRVLTDEVGRILEVDPGAADLLKVSQSALRGRDLMRFFLSDREELYAMALTTACGEAAAEATFERRLAPREGGRLAVQVRITARARGDAGVCLEWLLSPMRRTRPDVGRTAARAEIETQAADRCRVSHAESN